MYHHLKLVFGASTVGAVVHDHHTSDETMTWHWKACCGLTFAVGFYTWHTGTPQETKPGQYSEGPKYQSIKYVYD